MSVKRRRTDMTARRAALAITALAIALAGCASKTVGSASTSRAPSAIGSPPPNAELSPQVLMLNSPAAPTPDTEQARKAEAAELANSFGLSDSGVLQDAFDRLLGLPPSRPQSSAPPMEVTSPAPSASVIHFSN